ncbi:type II secretion system GspH family protein [Myxococcota bacterium]|nr:type II secretion system GspH family protein [Myxococcota bacterium]MBU1430413.1 type II secretion system GspH family protein [Myxococcota bacterium]MBU1897807.1 type II secretion system GspH family protein [Myxococcota bacterium]
MNRGYTIIEILIALVISSVGFAALFQMQISSAQGNISAREMAAAVNLAERYVETLQREAYTWVMPGNNGRQNSAWLNKPLGVWHVFTDNPVDHNGLVHNSVDANQGSVLRRQRFCVHYRLTAETGTFTDLLSVRVRVIWPRDIQDFDILERRNACDEDAAQAFQPNIREFFTITLPASVRRHDME